MRGPLSVLLLCLMLAGCGGTAPPGMVSIPMTQAGDPHITLWGTVYRPPGPGPFPAVVVLHHCAGIDAELHRWAKQLTSWGYVTIVPDSFGARGVGSVCATGQVRPVDRVPDAFAAAAYLRTLPEVRGDRIGVIGFSHGGGTVTQLVTSPRAGQVFAAAVGYYPGCPAGARTVQVPTLVLVGEKDDWTPAPPCQQWAERANDPARLDVEVYPGATHRFDYAGARDTYGQHQIVHHMRYDNAASVDATKRAEAFFARWLKN